ncbi:helix-turn-helix transcriptional regulator [Globicatella sanguinis]
MVEFDQHELAAVNYISIMPYTTQQTYSKWETGKSKPTIDKIPKISKVLEIPITSLFR